MDFLELDRFLRQYDEEEKLIENLIKNSSKKLIDNEIKRVYSVSGNEEEWIINSSKLMKEDENFSIHKHKRFVKFEEHKHDYIELIYVYSGEIKQIINGKEVNIKEGEICILDLNVVHSIEPAFEKDVAINIIMTGGFFDSIFMSFLSENDIMSRFIINAIYNKKEHHEYLIFPSSSNEFVQIIMKRLLCEYFDRKVAFDAALHGYMLLLFTELLRVYNINMGASKVKDMNTTIINELKNYLYKNYKVADLKTTAEFFHFNSDYLSKLIKNSTGQSFTGFLQQIKLKESCSLLKNSNFSIEEIVEMVGYNNLSHFYKLFKKKYNVTPMEYRSLMLKNIE
jgi:AraC family transcriptional regulator, dual regulator of chb operon